MWREFSRCSHTRRPRHITEEELRYILQIQGVLNNTSDLEDKRILINNINEELRGTEVSLASNKKTSFVIQSILFRFRRSHVYPNVCFPRDANGAAAGEQVSHGIAGRTEGRTGEASRRESSGAAEHNHQLVRGEPDEPVGDGVHGRERFARSPLPPLHSDGLSPSVRRHQETH